jgi:hypothetical protein
MLIYNVNAFVSVIAGVVAGAAAASFGMSQGVSTIFGLGVAAAADFYMRYKSHDVEGALWHPDAGGHVWFVPMWIVSLVGCGISIATFTGMIK